MFTIFWIVSLLSFEMASASSGAADDAIRFVHSERSLQPGEVILLEAWSTRPLRELKAKVFAHEFVFFHESDGLRWMGLVGIDLETKPGDYTIELKGVRVDGTAATGGGTFAVTSKKFPERRLTVEEKYVSPPATVMARIKEESRRVNGIFSTITPEKMWQGPFRLPVPGPVISSFGKRSVYNGKPRSPHAGVDFRGSAGTPVRAPNSCVVALATNLYYSGNTVILDHGLGLYSYFGHMSGISVKEGDRVETGEIVGKVGATGVVTGPHLHWTVRLSTSRIDPFSLVHVLGRLKDRPREN